MWWLNWDGPDYAVWQANGLRVDVSFQFTNDDFPPQTWGPDPYTTAYNVSDAVPRASVGGGGRP